MERIVRKNKLPVQVFHIKQNFTLTIKDLSVSLEQWQLDLFLYSQIENVKEKMMLLSISCFRKQEDCIEIAQ